MATPQQVGPGVYYVPADGAPVNAFSAFAAGFLKQRTPIAQALYKQRLAQLKPADRASEMVALLGLMQAEKQRLADIHRAVSSSRAGGGGSDSALATIGSQQIQAGTKVSLANTEAARERYNSGQLEPSDQFALDELKRNMEKGGGTPVTDLEFFISGLAGKLSPAQQSAVKRELSIVAKGQPNPEDVKGVMAILNVRFADLAKNPAPFPEDARAGGVSPRILDALLQGRDPSGGADGLSGADIATSVEAAPTEVGTLARALFDQLQAEHGKAPDIDFEAPIFRRGLRPPPKVAVEAPPLDVFRELAGTTGEAAPEEAEEADAPELTPLESFTSGVKRGEAKRKPAAAEEPTEEPADAPGEQVAGAPEGFTQAEADAWEARAAAGPSEAPPLSREFLGEGSPLRLAAEATGVPERIRRTQQQFGDLVGGISDTFEDVKTGVGGAFDFLTTADNQEALDRAKAADDRVLQRAKSAAGGVMEGARSGAAEILQPDGISGPETGAEESVQDAALRRLLELRETRRRAATGG